MARTYTLKRRAEQQAQTRRRIVEAAVELHGSIGPALTTVSMVAERAGVQRHTFYAHFPDERSLLLACSGLFFERDPMPDAGPWRAIEDPGERLHVGLRALYDWYGRNAELAAAGAESPRLQVRDRLMTRIYADRPLPHGFRLDLAAQFDRWNPHPIPGINARVLSVNRSSRYATLLLDVAPGTRFPAHHHSGAEECYVISGSLFTWGRRLAAGDFLHADSGTDHSEMWTDDGCQVLMVVPPEELSGMVG